MEETFVNTIFSWRIYVNRCFNEFSFLKNSYWEVSVQYVCVPGAKSLVFLIMNNSNRFCNSNLQLTNLGRLPRLHNMATWCEWCQHIIGDHGHMTFGACILAMLASSKPVALLQCAKGIAVWSQDNQGENSNRKPHTQLKDGLLLSPVRIQKILVILRLYWNPILHWLVSFERYWNKLSGGTIIFKILPLLGEIYHFLKFSQNTFSL
jgi:hypothetical protein